MVCCRVVDVDAVARDLAAVLSRQFGSGRLAHRFAAAADEDFGTEREEFLRHALAQSGSSASHQDAPVAQHSHGTVTGLTVNRHTAATQSALKPQRP
jgi:hypothetical protein